MFARKPCICQRPLHLETDTKHKTDDTHIYTYSGGEYKLYQIETIGRNSVGSIISVSALPMKIEEFQPLYRMPSFSVIGIWKVNGYSTEPEEISKANIKGKVVIVGEYACSIPKIVLDEAC